jgi:YD repeat-containing protein
LTFGTATDLAPMHANINDRANKVFDSQGQVIGWQVFNAANNSTESYDLTGRVTSIRQRDGRSQTFTYSDALTLPTIAPRAGLLLSVSDNFGYQLTFTYDAKARMNSVTSPDGEITTYQYDEASSIVVGNHPPVGNLTSVTYPGGKRRIYWYNEQDKTAGTNLHFALTGITDENGARYATYTYNAEGRAISTEHAGGVGKYTVEPWSPNLSYVTDPSNQRNSYAFTTVAGMVKVRSVEQQAGAGSNAATLTSTFDTQGNVISTKDANNVVTTFEYDLARNLEVSRTEAFGKPVARTTKTEYHPTLRIASRISEPKLRTTMTFDADGNVLTRTIQATTDADGSQGFAAALIGQARTWSYTYNAHGKLLTETGPRTDVMVRTTYTYDTAGNLKTVTNPAGQVTTFNTYDANGRATKVTGPDGRVQRYSYLPRGWLQSESIENAAGSAVQTTSFSYDDVGQLLSVTMPDQSAVYYTYDPAHRLTEVQDSLSNKIHYTLDNMGNRISEQVTDPAGNLARQITRQYDVLNRLQSQTGGVQ